MKSHDASRVGWFSLLVGACSMFGVPLVRTDYGRTSRTTIHANPYASHTGGLHALAR